MRQTRRQDADPPEGHANKVGGLVMVKEVDSSLSRQGTNPKLGLEHSTVPWKVVRILRPSASLI